VDTGNVENLAGAMESLLQNESLRTQFATNARRTFETHFALEVLSKKMIALYKQLLDGDNRDRA